MDILTLSLHYFIFCLNYTPFVVAVMTERRTPMFVVGAAPPFSAEVHNKLSSAFEIAFTPETDQLSGVTLRIYALLSSYEAFWMDAMISARVG